jgi:hypothetical protein
MRELIGESFTITLDMKKIQNEQSEANNEEWINPNVEVKVEKLYRYKEDLSLINE